MRRLAHHRDLLVILLVALGLRLSAIAPLHDAGYTSDEREYISLAGKLAAGEPFRDSNGDWSTKPPLWPFLLSVVRRLFGDGLLAAHVLTSLLGAFIVWEGFRFVHETTQHRPTALATASVLAVYPGLVVYATVLQTETLYIVLVLAALLCWQHLVRTPRLGVAAAMGMLAGLAALTRAVFVPFFPVLLVWLIWQHRVRVQAVLPPVAVAAVVFCLVLAPWTVRNYEIHHALVPVSSWGGMSALLGNNPYATGTWSTHPGFAEWFEKRAAEHGVDLRNATEVERSALARTLAVAFVAETPLEALHLFARKLYMFCIYPITNSDSDIPLQAICVAGDIALYGLAGIGFLAMGKQRRRWSIGLLAIAFFLVIHVALHVESRYRLPLVPFLAMYAGAGIALLLDTQRGKEFLTLRRHRIALGTWAAILTAVYGFTAYQFLSGKI